NVADLLIADAALWIPAVRGAFDAAKGAIVDFGQDRGIDSRQFATTLQVTLLGAGACCYGRLGDGGGVGRIQGSLIPLAPAPGNPYPSEAGLLTSPSSEPEVFFHSAQLSDCAIFTDGIQHLAMQPSHWKPHDPFFAPLFDFVRTNPDVSVA